MWKEDESPDNKWEAILIFNMNLDCLSIGVMTRSDDEFISSAVKRYWLICWHKSEWEAWAVC
jgi:hypothetical protein